jgi:hypothetical protein
MNQWILIALAVVILLLATGYPMIGIVAAAFIVLAYFVLPANTYAPLPGASAVLAHVQDAPYVDGQSMPPVLLDASNGASGMCVTVSGADTYEPSVPKPRESQPVLESDPFENPGQVDRMCEAQWFPRNQIRNLKEQQRDDFALQRAMRRDMEWGDVKVWSAEDKAKYEKARRRMESEIAGALRPDKYMIPEVDENRDYSATTEQPFSAILSDHQVFHTAYFRTKATNTGSIAGLLRTVI